MGFPVVENFKDIVADDAVIALDLDQTCFVAAAGAEKRTIIATHKKSGRQMEFKNKTEFWGRQVKVVGGWLKDQNTNMEAKAVAAGKPFIPWTRDDFTIEDKQAPEPVENCLHLLKIKINAILDHVESKNGLGVLGGMGTSAWHYRHPKFTKVTARTRSVRCYWESADVMFRRSTVRLLSTGLRRMTT